MQFDKEKDTIGNLFLRLLTLSTKFLFIKFAISKDLLIILSLSFNSLGVEEVFQSMNLFIVDHVLVELKMFSLRSFLSFFVHFLSCY